MEKLLEKLDSTTDRGVKAREELFTRIKKEMTAHEAIEEEIFYPALKKHAEAKEIVLEGFEEHHVVDLLLGELEQVSYDDETWGAKASVMKENVEHHIEEEEDDMFDKAEKLLDDDELESLGERMQNRKKEALGS